jgi:hypothetical protein
MLKDPVSGDSITAGSGNLQGDPLFADPLNNDYHLKTTRGRWSPARNNQPGQWIIDATNSPAIDAGDPAADFSRESIPNGGRVDLGAYGNRAEVGLQAILQSSRDFKISGRGANAFPYLLQQSVDLENWFNLGVPTNSNGQIEFLDLDSSGLPMRYYRIQQ